MSQVLSLVRACSDCKYVRAFMPASFWAENWTNIKSDFRLAATAPVAGTKNMLKWNAEFLKNPKEQTTLNACAETTSMRIATVRPTISQLRSLRISRSTFLHYIKFVDWCVSRLINWEMFGRVHVMYVEVTVPSCFCIASKWVWCTYVLFPRKQQFVSK